MSLIKLVAVEKLEITGRYASNNKDYVSNSNFIKDIISPIISERVIYGEDVWEEVIHLPNTAEIDSGLESDERKITLSGCGLSNIKYIYGSFILPEGPYNFGYFSLDPADVQYKQSLFFDNTAFNSVSGGSFTLYYSGEESESIGITINDNVINASPDIIVGEINTGLSDTEIICSFNNSLGVLEFDNFPSGTSYANVSGFTFPSLDKYLFGGGLEFDEDFLSARGINYGRYLPEELIINITIFKNRTRSSNIHILVVGNT